MILLYAFSVIFMFFEHSEYFALWVFLFFLFFFAYQIIQTFSDKFYVKCVLLLNLSALAWTTIVLIRIFRSLFNKNTDKISFGPKENVKTKSTIKIFLICSVSLSLIMYLFQSIVHGPIKSMIISLSVGFSYGSIIYSNDLFANTRRLENSSHLEERAFNWIKI